MFKSLSIFTILLSSLPTYAASGAIPTGLVVSQIVNLSLLIGLIYFTQRKKISQLFKDKRESYLARVQEASASKKAAEEKLKEVSDRLAEIEKDFEGQLANAQKQAEESYRDQLALAKNEAERLMSSSQNNMDFEVQKQIENLRVEAFKKSAEQAEQELENKMTPEQLKSWNSHFTSGQQGAH